MDVEHFLDKHYDDLRFWCESNLDMPFSFFIIFADTFPRSLWFPGVSVGELKKFWEQHTK